MTWRSCATGRRNCASHFKTYPKSRMSIQTCNPAAWRRTSLSIETRLSARTHGSQIDNALGEAFAQAQVSTIYNPFSPQQYHVMMEVAPEFWQHPEVLKQLYVSTSGGAVSGTQATQAVAGTTSFKTARPQQTTQHNSGGGCPDIARNLAANSLANAGRGNTSTGSAVSVSRETMVPFSAFSHFATGDHSH